jgi:prevent-host-death family protein
MKFVGVREAQAQLSGLVDQSQRERIVLTRHGQPIAVLTGVEGKDLEAVLLAQDPEFRRLIDERRRSQGELVSHEALKAQAERELAREHRVARPRARPSRGRAAKKR